MTSNSKSLGVGERIKVVSGWRHRVSSVTIPHVHT